MGESPSQHVYLCEYLIIAWLLNKSYTVYSSLFFNSSHLGLVIVVFDLVLSDQGRSLWLDLECLLNCFSLILLRHLSLGRLWRHIRHDWSAWDIGIPSVSFSSFSAFPRLCVVNFIKHLPGHVFFDPLRPVLECLVCFETLLE